MVPPLEILPVLCHFAANRMAELPRRGSQLVREALRIGFGGLSVLLPELTIPTVLLRLVSLPRYQGERPVPEERRVREPERHALGTQSGTSLKPLTSARCTRSTKTLTVYCLLILPPLLWCAQPDKSGNRYCINLVSVAGQPEEE
jgi:hypothetical protein